jgi:hypothetical protein
MHDLGLNFEASGTQRSEFYGEDIALHFVLEHGASQHRIALPWDSLGFQTSGKIYDRVRAQVALVVFGVFGESTGTGIESQPMKHIREVLQARPRHGFRHVFQQLRGRNSWAQTGNSAGRRLEYGQAPGRSSSF